MDNWYKINDDKNSSCGSAELKSLDWSFWFSDDFFQPIYVHVGRASDKTTHRVFPKKKKIIGLAYKNGELHWIQKGQST